MSNQISIPLNFILKVKKAVIVKLNCKDDFELHKKFEGLVYYRIKLKTLVGLYFVEKKFKIELINEKDILDFEDEFVYENELYKIVVFDIEQNIKIDNTKNYKYIFLMTFNEFKYVKYVATLESKTFKNEHIKIEELVGFKSCILPQKWDI